VGALFQQIKCRYRGSRRYSRYWPQAQQFALPAIQYAAREVRSGLLFRAFAEKRSAAASADFAARIQQHLSRYGVSPRDLVWQTDNGVTSKLYIDWKKTSSSIWKTSPAVATSSPRFTPISSTST